LIINNAAQRAILFVAWGDEYVNEINQCIEQPGFPDYPIYLLTDKITSIQNLEHLSKVIRIDFELDWKTRKAEMVRCFPEQEHTLLFLDTDTRLLGDISLGFDMAEKHGIAMAQAAHYSLEHFKDFAKIMKLEDLKPRGQLLYNSGVIFFHLNPKVREVFRKFRKLALKYPDAPWGDQTYLTLAMELQGFNPYTLSTGYNHRAMGEMISGEIRIWHSRKPIPKNVNEMIPPFPRKYDGDKIVKHEVPRKGYRSNVNDFD
jgi:hypothetical protein